MNIIQTDKEYIAPTYARFPLQIKKGKGSMLYDDKNNAYIDLGTGIAVNSFGVADGKWKRAVKKQLGKVQHTSNLYFSEPCALLAKELCVRTGMRKVFFSNSGAEANECAIKAARKHGEITKGADYNVIITLQNSFHGRTITTLSATGQDVFHQHFTPMTQGFVHAKPNDIEDMRALVEAHKCCGVMIELVQGEGGVMALDKEYVQQVAALAEEENLLFMVDEVQTGNGRTGALYAYMQYGVKPDVITTAKGLGGGLPIGATMLGDRAEKLFSAGLNGSTFGGNPVACAGALSVIRRIDDKLLNEVQKKSEYIFQTLQNATGVKSVSGMGLMIGIECEKDAAEIISRCMARGVLVIKAKNKLRLLPALNIPWKLLQKAMNIIKEECER
jgi:acetylornithine/N-succinyldiaminopimelate aminotransferase